MSTNKTIFLSELSLLKVKCTKEKNQQVFHFFDENRCIKTVFTYPKAKLFAEGIKFERERNNYTNWLAKG